MRAGFIARGLVCFASSALALSAMSASGQLFRPPVARPPVGTPTIVAAPGQPAPQAPAPAPAADPSALAPSPVSPAVQPGFAGPDQIMRARDILGVNIVGPDDQPMGTINDFIVDYQGGCPAVYYAMAPAAGLQLGQEYVILPYSALQYRAGIGGAGITFLLNVNAGVLRNSPHIGINDWSHFNDRRLLGDARQFYQRTERTAARPIEGANQRDGQGGYRNGQNEQGPRPQVAPRPEGNTAPGQNDNIPRNNPPRTENERGNNAGRPGPEPAPPSASPAPRNEQPAAPAPREEKKEK